MAKSSKSFGVSLQPKSGKKNADSTNGAVLRKAAENAKSAKKKAAGKPRRPFDVSAGLAGLLKKKNRDSANGVLANMLLSKKNTVGVGLKLPSFSLEALMRSTCWPLNRVTQIVGPQESGKSALMFEIIWWHVLAGGMGFIEEAETKLATELLYSLMRHRDDVVEIHWCESMDAWNQQAMLDFNNVFEVMEGIPSKSMAEQRRAKASQKRAENAPGRVFPFAICIDSVVGKKSEESIEKTDKRGSVGRSFPVENSMVKDFIQRMADRIYRWPASVILINHLKRKSISGMSGATERVLGSSEFLLFQESIEIEVNRVQRLKAGAWAGIRSKIRTMKNSTGQTDPFPVFAEMWWRKTVDPDTGMDRQETFWDWHKASMELLTSEATGLKKKTSAIVDITPVKAKNSSVTRYWSKALEIPKDSALEAKEAGEILMSREDILVPLRRLYQIREDMPFVPGVDYVEQCESAYARKLELLEQRRARGVDVGEDAGGDSPEEEEQDGEEA